MKTAAEARPAQLPDLQAPSLCAVVDRQVVEHNDSVGEAVQLHVALGSRAIIEEQSRAVAAGEELLEREDLPAKPKWIACQQPHLGERVDDDANGALVLDRGENDFDGLLQLDLGRMKERVGLVRAARLDFRELEDIHVVEGPQMRRGGVAQLGGGLRQRDVHATLTVRDAAQQELQPKRRLSGSWIAVDQIDVIAGEAAAQDGIQPGDAGAGFRMSAGLRAGIRRLFRGVCRHADPPVRRAHVRERWTARRVAPRRRTRQF